MVEVINLRSHIVTTLTFASPAERWVAELSPITQRLTTPSALTQRINLESPLEAAGV